ncbi:uncharacterized protein LOC121740451 [Aricia agestis]|uniref:uncharacterized protein LOC121740451 n=1 Tax=Aricia agestis TaxID=91739 RepID=UPI001C20B21E|nr:uncharacterized protein LOC121740451 [Aricia agestis]XP_041989090.1 uncharacterized protein LOC121740451 [Aricia agestis]
MRTLLLLALGAVLLAAAASSPVGPFADVTSRVYRSQGKTQANNVKGRDFPPPPPPAALNLRKGEYMCGDRVCRLQPGQVPEGCNGMCQYRLR